MKKKPIVGISMGDPFGIGPEIALKALADPAIHALCRPVVVGDGIALLAAQTLLKEMGQPYPQIHRIAELKDGDFRPGVCNLIDLALLDGGDYPICWDAVQPKPYGVGSTALGGEVAFRCVERLITLAMQGALEATVTNPISKEALHMAGHRYAGHTEIFAKMTGAKSYAMMLLEEDLRVVHVSTHVSLREACDRVKKERVLTCIRLADEAMRRLGIANPKIGVAGLNPHAGENGLFGREEIEEIAPAVRAAQELGMTVEGPLPPDTVFSKAKGGWYDVVVVMYHDQGHIPLKVTGFVYSRQKQAWEAVRGVNITLGLPIIRTSVDHGTAFDQAGCGAASPLSLCNAIEYAAAFCRSSEGGNGKIGEKEPVS